MLDEDVALKALGSSGALIVDVITIVGNFLYLVAYLIVLGDFGVQLMSYFMHDAESQRMYIIIVLGALGCYPLSLLPSINSLRFTSVLALVATIFFMGVVVAKVASPIIPY
jgi:amino acid permease